MDQIILLAFGVGVPAALAFHNLWNRRRAAAMERFANQAGLTFDRRDESLEHHALMALPIFQIGEGRTFEHVMRGQIGEHEVLIFDFRHRVGGLLSSLTHDSFVADHLLGIEANRKPTWYNMTAVVMQAPKVAEPTRTRVAGTPGGHTRLERAGEWMALYRFDRRVPERELQSFLYRALSLEHHEP